MSENDLIRKLYAISMSIGTSLDLHQMLDTCVNTIINQTGCMGGAVLFFKDSIDRKVIYKNIFSHPKNISSYSVFKHAVKSIGSLQKDMDWDAIKSKLPYLGHINDAEISSYHIFLLPYIGLLLLFKKGNSLDDEIITGLVPIMDMIANACSACLQKSELEIVTIGTSTINDELKQSEYKLKNTIRDLEVAQSAILSARNHMALILQSLSEGIMVIDEKKHISLMNVKAIEYLDYMPADMEKLLVFDTFSNCIIENSALDNFISDENSEDSVLEITVKKGHNPERILKISKTNIYEILEGPAETILLLRDVTIEKEIDRLKNDFISNLSHELRTPMNAILGISKIMSSKNSQNLTDRQLEGLNMIQDSGNRLLTLINNLLDISKIEAGKMELNISPLNLRDLLSSINIVVKGLIGEKDIVYIYNLSANVPEIIYSDPFRLRQILNNILGNAVKFTDSGNINLDIKTENDKIYFKCTDTGIGISSEKLSHIFERFRQEDDSISRAYEGSGLGLSLVTEIINLFGGDISITSEKNEGTEVTFNIPLIIESNTIDSTKISGGRNG